MVLPITDTSHLNVHQFSLLIIFYVTTKWTDQKKIIHFVNGFKFCTDIHWTQRMNRRDLANLLIYVTSRSNLSFTLQNIPLCIRWISAQHAIQIFMSPWGRIVTPLIPPPSVHPAPQSGYNINLSVKSFSFLHPAFSPFILIFIYFYTFSLPQPCVELVLFLLFP